MESNGTIKKRITAGERRRAEMAAAAINRVVDGYFALPAAGRSEAAGRMKLIMPAKNKATDQANGRNNGHAGNRQQLKAENLRLKGKVQELELIIAQLYAYADATPEDFADWCAEQRAQVEESLGAAQALLADEQARAKLFSGAAK